MNNISNGDEIFAFITNFRGVVLSQPPIWGITGDPYVIFNSRATGFTYTEWCEWVEGDGEIEIDIPGYGKYD